MTLNRQFQWNGMSLLWWINTYRVGQKTGPLCSAEILLRSARFICKNQSRLILNTKTYFTKINYVQQWRHLANTSHYFKWRSAVLLLSRYCRASFEIMTLTFCENDASYRITKSSPTDSPRTLVFVIKIFIQKFERVHPELGRFPCELWQQGFLVVLHTAENPPETSQPLSHKSATKYSAGRISAEKNHWPAEWP